MSGEAFFLADIVARSKNAAGDDDFSASSLEPFDDDDAEEFSTNSLPKSEDGSHSDDSSARPTDDRPLIPPPAPPALPLPAEIVVENQPANPIDTSAEIPSLEINIGQPEDLPPIPKGKSLAHRYMVANKVKVCSFDLETAGEYAGVVQVSSKMSSPNFVNGECVGFTHHPQTFNRYVQPPEGLYWNTAACEASHGLTPESPQIRSANDFDFVWQEFCAWTNDNVASNETCILVAYCGETCDLRWIWKYVQAPRSRLVMPEQIKFFMDPKFIIDKYTGCRLNAKHSKVESYELGVVWKFITQRNLNGAHDSMVDAEAQLDVISHKHFLPYFNKTNSIRLIEDIFTKTEKREMLKKMEPDRQVHVPWKEQTLEDNIEWEPRMEDTYNGASAGGVFGPSSSMLQIARTGCLATMFFFIFPLSLFAYIAVRTHAYAFTDWVVPTPRKNKRGETTKRPIMSPVFRKRGETLPANAQYRCKESNKKRYKVTRNFIIAWTGILIAAGAYNAGGDNNRGIKNVYRNAPYGVSVPWIQNTMPEHAFKFLRNFIHFSKTQDQKKKGEPGYDPLFKVEYVLCGIMAGLCLAWVAGQMITIDESCIHYMGRAVSFVMYNPKKPIKHHLKVFAVCCAYTAVLLGFEVYCGVTDDLDGSSLGVVKRLLQKSYLSQVRGRVLYTDNWYTTVKLAKWLFEDLGWRFCGTMVPSTKFSRQDLDVPFLKLSNGAMKSIPRGWFREAVVAQKTRTGKNFYVQCSTWKDKKQVMFLHTIDIGASSDHMVRRCERGSSGQRILQAPRSQGSYAKHFHAVDRNDRDSADYTVSIRTNRWYLRVYFWIVDRVVHMLFVVVVFCAKAKVGPEWWETYLKKDGRFLFQIDLAQSLINYAIENEWEDLDGPRPNWMRQKEFIPCDCNNCFFCIKGLTSGIAHKKSKATVTTFIQHDNSRTVTKDCTDKRVNLGRGSRYCRMCYRKLCNGTDEQRAWSSREKKSKCNTSRLGCPSCDEHICTNCWEEGYDNHASL